MLASSPEDIWSLPSLIDATVDKMAYLSKVIQRLPSFDSRVKAMEYLPEGYQSLVKAALLCWDALKSMAANCDHPHSFISDSAFFSLFKAAIKKALSSAERGDATLTLEDSLNIRSSTSSAASFESEKDKSTTSRRLPSAVLSRAGSSAGDEEPHMKPVPASFNLVDPLYPDPPSTETFLSTFLPLLSATLTPTRTQALRLMVSLRALSDEALHSRLDKEKRERIVYSQPELSFACAVFEQGVMGFGAETALAMAGLIVSPSKHSDSSSKQPGAEDVVQEGTPSKMMFLDKIKKAVHAAAMSKVLKGDGRNKSEDTQFVEDHEEEVEQQAVAPHDPTHVAAWLASTTPRLHWLEKLFPKPEVFRGIESAVKSNPDLWHQALHSLSHYCGYVREGEGPEGDDIVAPYSWRRRLGSLHWLLLVAVAVPHRISVACEALLCRHILGGPQDSMTPGDTLLVALQSTPASCPLLLTTTGCSDALDAIRQAQSCFAAGHSPLPPQPDDLGLQSTQVTVKHWDAADISYSSDAKERAIAEVTKAIKDHRWLVVLNAHSAPSLVLDMLHALSQSSYLIRGEGAR